MRNLLFLTIALFVCFTAIGQRPKKMIRKLGANPVLYLDSINIDNEQLAAIKPTDVAALSTYNGKEATDILGDDGKDGIVYIFTKKYAKNSYWNYFKSKSQEYSDKVVSPESDSTVQYILNKRILTTNFEGDLVGVNDKIFKEIVIINKETLISEYKILDKDFGVLIKSDIPENLYHAKKHY